MTSFTQRSLLKTTLLTFCTFGLYDLYYLIITRKELNHAGGDVPSAWLLLVPFLNLYFVYRYAQSYAAIIKKDHSLGKTGLYFLVLLAPVLLAFASGCCHMFSNILVKYYYSLVLNLNDPAIINHLNLAGRDFMRVYTMTEFLTNILAFDLVISAKIAFLQLGYNKYHK